MSYRVFVDACLWYPPSIRALILGATIAGVGEFATSEQVLDETYRHLQTRIPAAAAERVEAIKDVLATALEGGVVDLEMLPDCGPIGLPDPNDEHVVAGALATNCDGVLTMNRRDFPEPLLATVGLELVDVDAYFVENLQSGDPRWHEAVGHALRFPPEGVRSAADLGMRLHDLGLPQTAGELLSARW